MSYDRTNINFENIYLYLQGDKVLGRKLNMFTSTTTITLTMNKKRENK
jgi:hypothetical protein